MCSAQHRRPFKADGGGEEREQRRGRKSAAGEERWRGEGPSRSCEGEQNGGNREGSLSARLQRETRLFLIILTMKEGESKRETGTEREGESG